MNVVKTGNFTCLEEKMSAKKLFGSWKQNIGIILGAAILASGIFYVVNNPSLFTASILSLQEKNFIVEK